MSKTVKMLFALATAAILASCGETPAATSSSSVASEPVVSSASSADAGSDEEFDPNKPVEITFWHTMGKTTGQPQLDAMITEFNKIYPNITISHTQQGGYDELNEAINNNIATGSLPTMAYCYEDHVAGYLDHNAALDMTPYINDEKYGLGHNPQGYDLGDLGESDMVAGYWGAGKKYAVEGTYSLPFSKSTEALFYNKTVFEKNHWDVPETWDEMWDLCATIKGTEKYAVDTFTALGYDSDANLLITSFEQYGLPYTTAVPDATTGSHFAFNTQANKDLVTKLKDKYDKGYLITKGSSANSSYTSNLFTAGDCLMSIGSTGGTTYNYTQDFEVGVAGVPQANKDDKHVISQGPSICFFKRGTTKAQRTAAWLFYKFITNTNNSAYFGSHTGYNPVRTSSYSTHYYTTDMEDATGASGLVRDAFQFIGSSESGYGNAQFTSPAFKGSSVCREEMDGLLSSVLLGTKTVDKAFDDALSACIFAE